MRGLKIPRLQGFDYRSNGVHFVTVKNPSVEHDENLKLVEVYLKRLHPLLQAWLQFKLRWTIPHIPGTNNTSKHPYNTVWPRERKWVVRATEHV